MELDYVLYTDCDVLFESDINTCSAPPMPSVMYVGGESMPQDIANTGEHEQLLDKVQNWMVLDSGANLFRCIGLDF